MNSIVLVVAAAVLLMGIERLVPASPLPAVPGWWVRTFAINGIQALVVYLGAFTWDRWLPLFSWRAEQLGTVPAIALGYLTATFVYYWWHRARHEVPLLWRWMHQVHHSASRLEVATSFYKHPFEIVVNVVLLSFVLHVLLGLGPASASVVVTLTGLAEIAYHSNLRTPYWLGFIFQRPESHRRHHERHHHRGNYSDLPLWDMLFGTFDNPRESPRECGFSPERERQFMRMLLGRIPRREAAAQPRPLAASMTRASLVTPARIDGGDTAPKPSNNALGRRPVPK
jgi:sterol desaturase/sphingolipid hydroxylase (fatty acid hydroxylase superfamily)